MNFIIRIRNYARNLIWIRIRIRIFFWIRYSPILWYFASSLAIRFQPILKRHKAKTCCKITFTLITNTFNDLLTPSPFPPKVKSWTRHCLHPRPISVTCLALGYKCQRHPYWFFLNAKHKEGWTLHYLCWAFCFSKS